jgi:transposase
VRTDTPGCRVIPADNTTAPHGSAAGLTVRDVARRYRVGEDKVRAWIARGELKAINTAAVLCGRPRWVVPVDALAEFERRRAGGPPPKPQRRRRQPAPIDYYPD